MEKIESEDHLDPVAVGKKLFEFRDYTPIPLIIIILFTAEANATSATIGTLLVVLGELIRIWSVGFIGSISRTRKDNLGGKLVTEGPFSIVRNPLYVGNFFICFGLAFFSGVSWIVVLTSVLFGFQYYFIVKYEESLLEKSFGSEYETYMSEVPAWIPHKFIGLEDLILPESIHGAIKSEKRTLTAIGVMLAAILLSSAM